MENNSENFGEIKTFRQLIEGNVNTIITIPKIQRDYAQGRIGKEELRGNFLNDLFGVIEQPDAPLRIYDFIYGQHKDPEKREDSHRFLPVDGQQRLTTVFLLHIYIGKRGRQDTDFLRGFSYETRDSSKQFCSKLCKMQPSDFDDIVNVLADDTDMTREWTDDPTISGMIRMLRDIHNHFVAIENPDFELYWTNVTNKIAFWRLYLEDLDTTDDLYIKMNSRGKHLTDFENFKAEMDQMAQTEENGLTKGEFSKEMDTTWTNLFWAYRDSSKDFISPDYSKPESIDFTDNGLDSKMLTFFRNYLILEGLKNDVLEISKDADTLSSAALAKKVMSKSPKLFANLAKILQFFDANKSEDGRMADYFSKYLDGENIYEEERYLIDPDDLTDKVVLMFKTPVDLFDAMMTSKLNPSQMLIVEAFFVHIINGNVNEVDFKDRLRILRNLIANTVIRDDQNHIGDVMSALKSVDLLIADGLDSILETQTVFTKVQREHESAKLKWLADADGSDALTLKKVENYRLLRGNLSQLFNGDTPLTRKKLDNFRQIFYMHADYDFIEKVMIAFGDYYTTWRNGDGKVFNYVGPGWSNFRDNIFTHTNNTATAVLEKLLTLDNVSTEALESHCRNILKEAKKAKQFAWPYYIIKYKAMRWTPSGHYLMTGERYPLFMFNARTCYHNESYKHWNIFNDAVALELGIDDNQYVDNHGGPLTIPGANVKIDIHDERINIILTDGSAYYISIPNVNGIDTVDRVRLGSIIAKKLQQLSKKIIKGKNGEDVVITDSISSDDIPLYKCEYLNKVYPQELDQQDDGQGEA